MSSGGVRSPDLDDVGSRLLVEIGVMNPRRAISRSSFHRQNPDLHKVAGGPGREGTRCLGTRPQLPGSAWVLDMARRQLCPNARFVRFVGMAVSGSSGQECLE